MRKKHRARPGVESLDRRELMAAGITAHLSLGILSINGTSALAPIIVSVKSTFGRGGVGGSIVVQGVGTYRVSDVRRVVINEVIGERVVVQRSPAWNPVFQVNAPGKPITISKTPTPTPIPKPIPKPIPIPVPTPRPTPPPVATPTPTRTPVPKPIPTPTPTTPTKPPVVGSNGESSAEMAIVTAVNAARKQNGLAPLAVNTKLVQAAQIHARDMATLDKMAHDLPGAQLPGLADRAAYVSYNFATLGENIAFNYPDTDSVMNGWMNSPGHRANILGSDYTEIGVGIAYNSAGMPYYCQVFGRQF